MNTTGTTKTPGEREIADVVVIGGGGAGLAVAASASRRGMRTVLLEKNSELGGTTRLAVGSVTAACTRLQRRAGIADRADDFRLDMEAFTGDLVERDNRVLRSLLAAEAGVTVDWLEDLGVSFAGPYPEPPHRVCRMHNAIPGPRMIVAKLANAAKRAGLAVKLEATVHGLMTDHRGAVIGVDYSHGASRRQLSARRGVILATGDFSGNREMRGTFLSHAACAATPINPHNVGDGHSLAMRIGAAVRNMEMIFGPQLRFPRAPGTGVADRLPEWTWLARLGAQFFMRAPPWMLKPLVTSLLIANMSPSERLFEEGAVLIDIRGNRLNTATPAVSLAEASEARGYIVLDERIARCFTKYPYFISTAPGIAFAYFADYARGRPDIVHRAPTVQALARLLGMNDGPLGEALEGLQPGALFALGPVQAMLTTTEGSVAVDEQCRVLKEDGNAVEGLYATGCVGQGGLLLRGHGLHLAWALTSGRIAGEMAARRIPLDPDDARVATSSGANTSRPCDGR